VIETAFGCALLCVALEGEISAPTPMPQKQKINLEKVLASIKILFKPQAIKKRTIE
jgi:hypothetical protein